MIRKILNRIKTFIYDLTMKEKSPQKLTLSCCLGIYIAFSPWFGFHTIMIFACSWMLGLNAAITFTSTYLLNNPWTCGPLYLGDYFFGDWILRSGLGLDSIAINPSWMTIVNAKLTAYTGFKGLSFWAFIVGGNLLGIILSVILYPVLYYFFSRISSQPIKLANQQNEDNRPE